MGGGVASAAKSRDAEGVRRLARGRTEPLGTLLHTLRVLAHGVTGDVEAISSRSRA